MDISLLSTTSDPEQLRALAIAMVQKAMAESQNLANMVLEKDRNIAELQNRIRIL
ncbi:TPA: IS66 family transposase, partial [Escherichia coli]|nr:IS66 family transposase [Escherichia coli]